MLGYHWPLVRSIEYWWLDSAWTDFGCWSFEVSALFFFFGYMPLLCSVFIRLLWFKPGFFFSKVPEEFVLQHPTNGNPPTLFLVLHGTLLCWVSLYFQLLTCLLGLLFLLTEFAAILVLFSLLFCFVLFVFLKATTNEDLYATKVLVALLIYYVKYILYNSSCYLFSCLLVQSNQT